MKNWDKTEQEYAFDQGWRFDENETLVLTNAQFSKYAYSGRSITDNTKKTLMLPSAHGCSLIFEGKHFRIEG
jgi:hypothetical protein